MRLLSRRRVAAAALLVACAALGACRGTEDERETIQGARVLVDGAEWDGGALLPDAPGMRVYLTWDGEALMDMPFDGAHTITVIQPEGGKNVIEITGEAVFMAEADCENQDCVKMGPVTRENMEYRVMGGFIVCLPHRLSVEVRGE